MRLLTRATSPGHVRYLRALHDPSKPIVLVTGPAGSGKTAVACRVAQETIAARKYHKLLLTKPAIGVDEEHGFLPGDLGEKMKPWILPMTDELYGPVMNTIEATPLAYMRGRTFERSFVIADEMQNATPAQMKMLLTRLGNDSKIVITGDMNQLDLQRESGLSDILERLSDQMEYIEHVELEKEDIKRHPAIMEVLDIYGE